MHPALSGFGLSKFRAGSYRSAVDLTGLCVGNHACTIHSPDLAHNVQYDPLYCIQRFETRPLERWLFDATSERSELLMDFTAPFETDVWWSYSMLIEDGPPVTTPWAVFGQWHASEDAGDISASPPFALEISPSTQEMGINTRGSAANPLTGIPPAVFHWTRAGMRGAWHDWVFRSRFSYGLTGQLQVWLDGTEIINVSGIRNAYNDAVGPYFKYGIYRGQSPSASAETLVAHYANLELGTASLASRITRPRFHPYRS